MVFFNNHYGFWKPTFVHQVNVTYKVRKRVYNIEMYFKQFFTWLKRTSTFITALFRTLYRGNSPNVFSKKGALLQICSILTEEYPCRSVISIMLKSHFCIVALQQTVQIFTEHLSWKTPLGDCFSTNESEYRICQSAFTCSRLKWKTRTRFKICSKLIPKTPERQS